MGKRVDVVIPYKDIVFILEFKCGGKKYEACAYDQVYDYALDLRNFQKESHDKLLAPILISTKAADTSCEIQEIDKIIKPIRCNADNIMKAIDKISDLYIAEEHFISYKKTKQHSTSCAMLSKYLWRRRVGIEPTWAVIRHPHRI